MADVRRIYVEKKDAFAVKAKELQEDLKNYLGMTGIDKVRVLIRYDVENISEETFQKACKTVFSEPPVDPNAGKCKMFFCRVFTGTVRPACGFRAAVYPVFKGR